MIEECPLIAECRLVSTKELPSHSVFFGEVVGVYVDGDCINDGKPDMWNMDPLS